MKTSLCFYLIYLTLCTIIIGCGGSDNPDEVVVPTLSSAKFSLGVSDAPVDDAEIVSIEIDSIKLINTDESNGGQEILIDEFIDENGLTVDTIQVNLLDFQGQDQMKIIDESQGITLTNGVYKMELAIVDSGSFVMLDNDAYKYNIKVHSSRLKLGEFTITDQAQQVAETPAYTLEFDLRKSLVLRGNNPMANGYILKPNGVRIVSLPSSITGIISPEYTNLGVCTVYLYEGTPTELADIYDIDDEAFIGETPTATAPIAAVVVGSDSTYNIGFLDAGSYTVAMMCGTGPDVDDDNIQFDGLAIPSPAENSQTVEISTGTIATVNF